MSAVDGNELNDIVESIVGKLWKGYMIPEHNIETLFSTIDKSSTHLHENREANFLKWEAEMLEYLAACHVKDSNKIKAIQDFSRKAKSYNFPNFVINRGLQLILNAY